MSKDSLKISVVICVYTAERLPEIREAVASVLAQTMKPYEVILAVDHNRELYHKLQKEFLQQIRLILNDGDEKGAVATDNVGIAHSGGDIVAFIDDDAVAEKDWLKNMVRHYKDHRVGAVGGRLVSVWDKGRPQWFPEEIDWIVGGTYKGHPEIQTQVRNLILCNMSVRKEIFQSVGDFATELGRSKNWGTGAESQFFLRMKHSQPNTIILYDPGVVVYHKVPLQRTNLRYLVLRSYNEGFHKAMIQKTTAALSQNPLSTEKTYLRYLLFTAIPQRLKRFYKKGSLFQVGVIIITIIATGMGYLIHTLKE